MPAMCEVKQPKFYGRYPIMTSDVRFPEVFCPTLTLCQYIM